MKAQYYQEKKKKSKGRGIARIGKENDGDKKVRKNRKRSPRQKQMQRRVCEGTKELNT